MIWAYIGMIAFGIGASGASVNNSEAYGLVALAGVIIWSAHLLVERR